MHPSIKPYPNHASAASKRTLDTHALRLGCLLLIHSLILGCGAPHEPVLAAPEAPKTQKVLEHLGHYWQIPLPKVENQAQAAMGYVHKNRDTWIHRIIPEKTRRDLAAHLKSSSTAAAQIQSLKNDSSHTKHYWAEELIGSPDAENVIWLVPQYHRSSEFPALWSSLGAEIAQVQANIETIITHLHHAYGLDCVGIEGSSAKSLSRSRILDQAARWAETLAHAFQKNAESTNLTEPGIHTTMNSAMLTLAPYFERYVQMLDGVGIAIHRLLPKEIKTAKHTSPIHRFGLEDSSLNQQAVTLLESIRALEKTLILRSSGPAPDESPSEYALRAMWLDEFPSFSSQTLTPIDQAITALLTMAQSLKREGLTDDAQNLTTFIRHFRLVYQKVLRPDDVRAYQEHYLSVDAAPQTVPTEKHTPAPLSPEEISHNATIKEQLAPLYERYDAVAHQAREEHAIARTLEAMQQSSQRSCALVMGAGHLEALKKRLTQAAPPGTALIVVRPFAHEL